MAETDTIELEKKRTRSQFSKDERFHLLKIMEEYGAHLNDRNLSILSRKEIWMKIEKRFNDGPFFGRTSSQLKKYWQNYKYHSKKMKLLQKPLCPENQKVIKSEGNVSEEDWNQYNNELRFRTSRSAKVSSYQNQLEVELAPKLDDLSKFCPNSAIFKVDLNSPIAPDFLSQPLDLSTKKFVEELNKSLGATSASNNGVSATISHSEHKLKQEVENRGAADNRNSKFHAADALQQNSEKFDIVVSDTEVTGNKVTVSVICPRKTPSLKRKLDSTRNSTFPIHFHPTCNQNNFESKRDFIKIKSEHEADDSEAVSLNFSLSRDPAEFTENNLNFSILRNRAEYGESKVAKSAQVNTNVIPGSKNWNRFDAIKTIPGRPCFILKEKNTPVEKVVDKNFKENSFLGLGCSSEPSERSDEDSESQKSGIDVLSELSNNSESFLERGLRDFTEVEREESEVKMDDAEETSDFGTGEDPSSDFFIKFEWDHRLVLRQLETKEMLLKLRIAEMAIEETKLRIRAIDEERSRSKELHEIRLTQMAERNLQCTNLEDSPPV